MTIDFNSENSRQKWEEIKRSWDERIRVYLQAEAVSKHDAVLTGDLTEAVNYVWSWIESNARFAPVIISEHQFKLAVADVVHYLVTGEDPFKKRLESATQMVEEINALIEGRACKLKV